MPKTSFLIEDILENSSSTSPSSKLIDDSNKYKCFKKKVVASHHQTSPNSISPASSLTSSSDDASISSNTTTTTTTTTTGNTNLAAAAAAALDLIKQQQQQQLAYSTTNILNSSEFDYSSWQHFLLSQYYSRFLATNMGGLMANSNSSECDQQPVSKRARRIDEGSSSGHSTDSSSSSSSSSSSHSNVSPKSTSGKAGDDESGGGSGGNNGVSPLDALLQLANSSNFVNKHNMPLMDANVNRKLAAAAVAAAAAASGRFGTSANGHFEEFSSHLGTDLNEKQHNIHLSHHFSHHHLPFSKSSSQNTSFESKSASLTSNKSSSSSSCSSIPNTHHHIPITSSPTLPLTSSGLVPANPLAAAASSTNTSSLLKRKRKNRTAFTATQIFELERRFSNQRYLSPHDRDRIAHELSLSTAQVITWFQNRRAKQKRDIEELKNDVLAAKTLKQIDPDVDVDRIVRAEPLISMNPHHHSTLVARMKLGSSGFSTMDPNDDDEYNGTNDGDDDDDDEIDIDNESISDDADNDDDRSSLNMNNSVSSSLRINSND